MAFRKRRIHFLTDGKLLHCNSYVYGTKSRVSLHVVQGKSVRLQDVKVFCSNSYKKKSIVYGTKPRLVAICTRRIHVFTGRKAFSLRFVVRKIRLSKGRKAVALMRFVKAKSICLRDEKPFFAFRIQGYRFIYSSVCIIHFVLLIQITLFSK